MKRMLLFLMVLSFLGVNAQGVLYTKDPNSPALGRYQDSVEKHIQFVKEFNELSKKYSHKEYNYGEWEFWNSWCGCDAKTIVHWPTPVQPIQFLPEPQAKIITQHDTVKVVKWKVRRDTIAITNWVIIHDSILQIRVVPTVEDSLRLVKFTTTDHQVNILKTDSNDVPYIEKRFYDYEGQLVKTQKLDPITSKIIDDGQKDKRVSTRTQP